jgi:hypothetical protein
MYSVHHRNGTFCEGYRQEGFQCQHPKKVTGQFMKIFPLGVSFKFITLLDKPVVLERLRRNTSRRSKFGGFPDEDYWGEIYHSAFDITPVPRYTREPPPVFHGELRKKDGGLIVFVKVSAVFADIAASGFWAGAVGAIYLGFRILLTESISSSAGLQIMLLGIGLAGVALLVANLFWYRVKKCKEWLLAMLDGTELT